MNWGVNVIFKAVIEQQRLKKILSAVTETVDESRLNIGPDGIRIVSTDPATVRLTYCTIPAEAFELYEADRGDLGVDLSKMESMISDGSPGEKVTLELGEDKSKLYIYMGRMRWTMSLLSLDSIRREPKLPSLEMPAAFTIPGREFQRVVKAAERLSNHLRIGMEDNQVFFKANGDVENVSSKFEEADLRDFKYSNVTSLFPMDYLRNMAKSAKDSPDIRLEIGQDFPLRMGFNLTDGPGGDIVAEIRYVLAPRIEAV